MSEDANTIAVRRWREKIDKIRNATDRWIDFDVESIVFDCPYCDRWMSLRLQCNHCGFKVRKVERMLV